LFDFRLLQQCRSIIRINQKDRVVSIGYRISQATFLDGEAASDIRSRQTARTGFTQERSQGFWLWLQPPDLQALIPLRDAI